MATFSIGGQPDYDAVQHTIDDFHVAADRLEDVGFDQFAGPFREMECAHRVLVFIVANNGELMSFRGQAIEISSTPQTQVVDGEMVFLGEDIELRIQAFKRPL